MTLALNHLARIIRSLYTMLASPRPSHRFRAFFHAILAASEESLASGDIPRKLAVAALESLLSLATASVDCMNILHKNGAMEELREHQNLLAQCYTTVVEIAKRAAVQDTTSSTKLEVREKKEKNYQIVRQQKGKASPPFLLLCFFCPFFF